MDSKISLGDVKNALKDSRFRMSLPKSMSKEVDEFLGNPGCACHIPLYRKIMRDCREQLSRYYPGKAPTDPDEEVKAMAHNRWTVINCHVDDLEAKLSGLGPGRKQLDVARWNDQVTVVINELDLVF